MKRVFFIALLALVPTVVNAAPGSLSDCSGTATSSSAAITFAHAPQAYLQIANPDAANVLWVNPVGGAAAANTAGSAPLLPSGYLWFDGPVQPGSINIIAPSGNTP